MKNPFKNSKESNVGNSPKVEKDSKNSKGKPKKNSIIYFFKSAYEYGIFSNVTNFILFILITQKSGIVTYQHLRFNLLDGLQYNTGNNDQ